MKKLSFILLFTSLLFIVAPIQHLEADQVDLLIKKLIEKGILTEQEAQEIKNEVIAEESSLQEKKGSAPKPQEPPTQKELPQWVQDMKLKGDFRLRHEWAKRNDSTDLNRNRGRIRYRLNLETKVNDQVQVVAGLASNGGSPRGTNVTFSDTFAKSSANLDLAYVQYTPNEHIALTAGKMRIPFWTPMEFLWDADLTPEGGAANFNWKINERTKLFSNVSALVIDEIATDESDPFMYTIQSGMEWNKDNKLDSKLAVNFIGFDNGAKQLLDSRSSPATNTVNGGRYDFTYNTISVATEFGINNPFDTSLPRLAMIGEFVHNPDPSKQNNGWIAGSYLGSQKVSGPHQWKITGTFRFLGADAWLDAFPDADFYGGATDVKGYETILEYGLTKNISIMIDYYRSQRIKTEKAPESLLQTDINFKF